MSIWKQVKSWIDASAGDLDTNKADKSNVLQLDNTTPFTPDADYEPATKKYVDDNVGGGAFTDLSDVPVSYASQANKYVKVKATEDGLEFITLAGGGDMLAATYDPTNIAADAFDMDNMVDGAIYVKTENNLTDALKSNYDAAYSHSEIAHAPANALTQPQVMARSLGC